MGKTHKDRRSYKVKHWMASFDDYLRCAHNPPRRRMYEKVEKRKLRIETRQKLRKQEYDSLRDKPNNVDYLVY